MNDLLFPPDINLTVAEVAISTIHLNIFVKSNHTEATCPLCHTKSKKIHGYYYRHPKDLPCFGRSVQLHIEVQRFRCLNLHCKRLTFSERYPNWLTYKARRTERLQKQHLAVAFNLSGEAGRRLSNPLSFPISGDTLIRDIRKEPGKNETRVNVVGIDDWAKKRGCNYGTIIVDLEKREPIELLDSREANAVTTWLQEHPEIRIVSRDRSQEYAKAVTLGAPQAQQVAARWHLLKNLREAIENFLQQKPATLLAAAQEINPIPSQVEAKKGNILIDDAVKTTATTEMPAESPLPILETCTQKQLALPNFTQSADDPIFSVVKNRECRCKGLRFHHRPISSTDFPVWS